MTAPPKLGAGQGTFLERPGLLRIWDLIERAGGRVRVNGGAVRNALLGEAVGDVDLSTTLLPEQAIQALNDGGLKTIATGIEHGTITAVCDGNGYEITTLREDIETDGRHAVVRFGTDWTADARRRDFTMNALYCDREGVVYDPLNGFDDLVARRVRFIGDADDRIREDYLRILRFFRFFAWYGDDRPDPASLKACVRHRNGLYRLSAERVWAELKKLLSAPDPTRSALWMRTAKILSAVLPESEKWGIDLLPPLVATRTQAGDEPDPLLRLMAMIPPRKDRTETIASRLKLSRAETRRLENWAQLQDPPFDLDRTDLEKYLYRHDRQAVLDRFALEVARLSQKPDTDNAMRELDSKMELIRNWKQPEFPLQGQDLLDAGHTAGPSLGKTLARLEQDWIESGFALSRQQLLEHLSRDQ